MDSSELILPRVCGYLRWRHTTHGDSNLGHLLNTEQLDDRSLIIEKKEKKGKKAQLDSEREIRKKLEKDLGDAEGKSLLVHTLCSSPQI